VSSRGSVDEGLVVGTMYVSMPTLLSNGVVEHLMLAKGLAFRMLSCPTLCQQELLGSGGF